MKKWWIVEVLGVTGALVLVFGFGAADMEEYERTRYVEWWADEIKVKTETCREWADVAERATTIRMRYTAAFGAFSVDMELSAEEQARIRKLLLSDTVPLALGGPSAGFVMLDDPGWYLEMPDENGNVRWVDLFALQSLSSLRKIPDYEAYNDYVHAMISEEDRAFLDALEKRIKQKLKSED